MKYVMISLYLVFAIPCFAEDVWRGAKPKVDVWRASVAEKKACDCVDPSTCDCPRGQCNCSSCYVWIRDESGHCFLWRHGVLIGNWSDHTPGQTPKYYPVKNWETGEYGPACQPPITPPEPVKVSQQQSSVVCRT